MVNSNKKAVLCFTIGKQIGKGNHEEYLRMDGLILDEGCIYIATKPSLRWLLEVNP